MTASDRDGALLRVLLPFVACSWGFVCVAGEVLAWHPVGTARLLALLLASGALLGASPRRRVPAVAAAAVALAVLVALSLAWSRDGGATLRVARHVGGEAVLLTCLLVSPRRDRLWRPLAGGAILGALLLAGAFAHAALFDLALHRRLHLWGGDANHEARGLFLGVLAASLWLRRPPAVLAGLIAMAGGLSGSRGAALAVWGALLHLGRRGTSGQRRAAVLVAMGVGLGLALVLARPDLRSPLTGVVRGDAWMMTSGRTAIWANTGEIVRENPVLGVGAGAVQAAYDRPRDQRIARGGARSMHARDAHSQYLESLASLGPAGLLALLVLLASAGRGGGPGATLAWFAALSCLSVTTWEQKGWWLAITLAALAPRPTRGSTAPR